MIESIEVKKPKDVPVRWFADVFPRKRKWDFKPGLNVVWGRNGSGKSTLLRMLARYFHAEQATHTAPTNRSIHDFFGLSFDREELRKPLDAVDVRHDGQSVCFFDPSQAKGLDAGGAAFDDDFFSEGVRNALFKGSSGQTGQFRMAEVLHFVTTGKFPEYEIPNWDRRSDDIRCELLKEFLQGNIDKGQPTVMLDEPDRSYDIVYQYALWSLIQRYADRVQFIVAAHSLFALGLSGANYIEVQQDGYLDSCKEIKQHFNDPVRQHDFVAEHLRKDAEKHKKAEEWAPKEKAQRSSRRKKASKSA